MKRLCAVVVALSGSTLGVAAAAPDDHQQVCRLGETVRRIEVRFEGDAGRPPCEVVYIKETERPGQEDVLWTATRDAAFCRAKADGLAALLTRNGWSCSGGPAALEAALPEPRAEPEAPDAAAPEAAPARAEPAPEERPELPEDDEAPLDAAAVQPDEPEPDAGVGGAFIPAEALEAAVERDLARLKRSAEAEVEADIGSFGDLNGDAVEDAAVLITFDSDGPDHAQYLVAYVAEGGTYRPAASRFIGGRYRKVFGGAVAAIEAGRIRLELQVLEADDAYCCPTGSESALFALENGELVSVP